MADDELALLIENLKDLGSGTPTWALFLSAAAIILAATLGAIWQRRISRQTLTYNTLATQMWDKDYIAARKQFIGVRDNDGGEKLKELAQRNAETQPESQSVRYILNNYELIAIGISSGVLDEQMLKDYQRSTTCRDWERMKPYIDEVRKAHPTVYVEFEKLYEKWRNGG